MKNIIVAILFVVGLLLLAYAINVVLIAFAGILVGILLRTAASWLHDKTGISDGWCLSLVVMTLLAIGVANIWLFGVNVAYKLDELNIAVSKGRETVERFLQQYEWSRRILSQGANGSQVVSSATSAVTKTVHFAAAMILMLFVALYTASNPELYIYGVTRLFPKKRQNQVHETLHAIGGTLRWWLLGQLVSMTIVGVLTTVGLWILHVPLAVTLGFITAILNFIPNIGAIVSLLFAVALALTQGPVVALYVVVLFLIIQSLEAYVVTPLIQQRVVSLPPALTIVVQACMGVVIGPVGIALAAPLTVVGLVLTKRLHLSEKIPPGQGQHRPQVPIRRWQT